MQVAHNYPMRGGLTEGHYRQALIQSFVAASNLTHVKQTCAKKVKGTCESGEEIVAYLARFTRVSEFSKL